MKKFEVVVEYSASRTIYIEAKDRDRAKEIAISGFQTDCNKSEDIEITDCIVTDYWE